MKNQAHASRDLNAVGGGGAVDAFAAEDPGAAGAAEAGDHDGAESRTFWWPGAGMRLGCRGGGRKRGGARAGMRWGPRGEHLDVT